MGKLIILSGPSGVGKGPLTDALIAYFGSIGLKLHKHVLYNDRSIRPGEQDGITYHFRSTNDLLALHEKNPEQYAKIEVRKDLQLLDFVKLQEEIDLFDIVLLEIYYKKIPDVLKLITDKNNAIEMANSKKKDTKKAVDKIKAKHIFVSPLCKDDFASTDIWENEQKRAAAIKAVMLTKLKNRGTETNKKQQERSDTAAEELDNAINTNAEILTNHFGEDNKHWWQLFHDFVSVPGALELAKTFIMFEQMVLE